MKWFLSRDEVREVDRRAIDEYGVPGVVLMENAGRGAAELLVRQGIAGEVVICCGAGNNGGDGYVMARHLELAGNRVQVLSICPLEQLRGDARINAEIARRAGIDLCEVTDASAWRTDLTGAAWIVDALLGTGLQGAVRPAYAAAIEAINAAGARVLAVDLPSGLDCDTGAPCGPCIRADVTATFVAWKRGFAAPSAAAFLGPVHVIDIGAPLQLLREMGRPADVAE